MPLRMSAGMSDKVFIVGRSKSGKPGIKLLAGQVVTVIPENATVIITPDASPLPVDADYVLADGTPVPKGTATQFSGTVSLDPTAVDNAPVNVTESIKNADGSPVLNNEGQPIADLTDTVTQVPDLLESEGELFGVPA